MIPLKQQFRDLLNKDWNDIHFDEEDLTNIVKNWLTQKRQEQKPIFDSFYSRGTDSYISTKDDRIREFIDELLEELQK